MANGSAMAQLAAFGAVAQNLEGVVPGAAAGIQLAITSFESQDTLNGVGGLMDICAAVAPLLGAGVGGAFGGPAGAGVGSIVAAVVGSFFTMIADVLGSCAPQAQTLADEISDQLRTLRGEDKEIDLFAIHRDITTYANSLNDACSGVASAKFPPGVTAETIRELNPIEGSTMKAYWGVVGWLKIKENQELPRWPIVLDGACNAYALLLMAIVRLRCIVSPDSLKLHYLEADQIKDPNEREEKKKKLADKWDELVDVANAKLISFGWCNELHLQDLKELAQAARNRGSLWRVGPDDYELRAGLVEPSAQYDLNNRTLKMSVAVRAKELTLPFPKYQVYFVSEVSRAERALRGLPREMKLFRRVVRFEKNEAKLLMPAQPVGDTGTDLVDVFAIPGTDQKKDEVYVYELSSKEPMNPGSKDGRGRWKNKVVGTSRDADDKATGTLFTSEWEAEGGAKSVRVVYDPYTYADDPANGSLDGIKSIVYLTIEHGSHVRIMYNPLTEKYDLNPRGVNYQAPGNVVNTPIKIEGIAVDQDYLWAFSKTEFVCATHASVARGNRGLVPIAWRKCTSIPDPGGLKSFYPADDGTLVVSGEDKVYTSTYRTDLKRNTIEVSPWKPIPGGHAQHGLEKLPVFCWPQFEGLVYALEELEPSLSPAKSPVNIWGIGKTDEELYRCDGVRFNRITAKLKSIAVGGRQVWGIRNNGGVCRWNGSSFEGVPDRVSGTSDKIQQLAVSDTEVWALDQNGAVLKYSWFEKHFVINPGGRTFSRIVASSREVWGIEGRTAYRLEGDTWELVRCPAAGLTSIAMNYRRAVWAIGGDDKVYRWNEKVGNEAQMVEFAGMHFVSMAVGGKEVWGIDANGRGCRLELPETGDPSGAFQPVGGVADELATIVVSNGQIWGINRQGSIWWWNETEFKEPLAVKSVQLKSIVGGG